MSDLRMPPETFTSARAIHWAQALDHLDVQIRALRHEPEIGFELLVLWEMLVRLRRAGG